MENRLFKIVTGAAALLGIAVLIVLFFFSEPLTDMLVRKPENSSTAALSEEMGASCLTLSRTECTFNGAGIFDPMEGVTALDVDGSDIAYKTAVTYVTGDTIQEKEIRYTLYNANRQKLVAFAGLTLENYTGPQIEISQELRTVEWEQLQNLTDVLAQTGALKGDDGFGNDATALIAYSYEIDWEQETAEITFSLTNQFQDVNMAAVRVEVEGIPRE